MLVGCEPNRRRTAFVPRAEVQSRLRSLYHYTMYKRIANPLLDQPEPVRKSQSSFLERLRPASGTAAPAGVPFWMSVRRPKRVVSESLERAGGTFREDSRKESFLSVWLFEAYLSRSLSTHADLSV